MPAPDMQRSPGSQRKIIDVVHGVRLAPVMVFNFVGRALLPEIDDAAFRTIHYEPLKISVEIQVHGFPDGIGQAHPGPARCRHVQRQVQLIRPVGLVKQHRALHRCRRGDQPTDSPGRFFKTGEFRDRL